MATWKSQAKKGKSLAKKIIVGVLLVLGALSAIGYVLNKTNKTPQSPQ